MVMEFLQGSDLSQYLERTGPLPIEEAVEYVLQACEALAEAHSLGIIHRDLKPANLFRTVRPDGTPAVKLLDFGISKVTTADQSMTQTSSMMGSPLYMAPEQMTSAKHVDARADVWAIGVILHELVAAHTPFGGETVPELCAKILTQPPPPLRQLRPDAPPALERVILRCLEKDREARYPNVAALAADLRPFAPARAQHSIDRVSRVLGVSALTSAVAAQTAGEADAIDPEQEPRALTQGAWGKTQSGSRRRSSFGAALVAVALLVAGGATATVLLLRSQDGATSVGAASPLVAVDGGAAKPNAVAQPAVPELADTGATPAPPAEAAPPTPANTKADESPAPASEASATKPSTTKAPSKATTTKSASKPAQAPQTTHAPPPVAPAPAAPPPRKPVDLYSDRK
jgi:serine/threonine-protein kinase